MKVSKMHYAEELARRGNKVFFVNPPRERKSEHICSEEPSSDFENITLIHIRDHRWRLLLRDKFFPLYRLLESKYIKGIRKITGPIDEVWNFNPLFVVHAKKFGAPRTLLMMYDLFRVKAIQKAAVQSDAIISVSQDILNSFGKVQTPKMFINHGLAPAFELQARKNRMSDHSGKTIKIGYTGNLFHPGIARRSFMKIVSSHPDTEFHIWGADGFMDNNLSTNEAGEEILSFIAFMKARKNVFFHGMKAPDILAKEIEEMDGFLAVYSPGSNLNAHKILEYLSTGKAVFATAIEQYRGTGLLVQDDEGKLDFPTFFANEIKGLQWHNSEEKQQQRIVFALDNTYARQVDRIFVWEENIRAPFAVHSD